MVRLNKFGKSSSNSTKNKNNYNNSYKVSVYDNNNNNHKQSRCNDGGGATTSTSCSTSTMTARSSSTGTKSGSNTPPENLSVSPDPGVLINGGEGSISSLSPHMTGSNGGSISNSPSTSPQPKKAWERNFKTFLKKHKFPNNHQNNHSGSGGTSFSLIAPPQLMRNRSGNNQSPNKRVNDHDQPSLVRHNHNSIRQGSDPPRHLPRNINDSTPSGNNSLSLRQVYNDDTKSMMHYHQSTINSPSEVTASTSDTAVRGGSLFKSVFKKPNKQSCSTNSNSNYNISNSGGLDDSQRRRNKSSDSLDQTSHRGVQRRSSGQHCRRQMDDEISDSSRRGVQRRSSGQHCRMQMDDETSDSSQRGLQRHSRNLSHDEFAASMERSVHGGSLGGPKISRNSSSFQHQPSSQFLSSSLPRRTRLNSLPQITSMESYNGLDSIIQSSINNNGRNPLYSSQLEKTHNSSSQTTELKKQFTEFHNSKEFGKDTSSPYLGDESSVHRNNLFAMHVNHLQHPHQAHYNNIINNSHLDDRVSPQRHKSLTILKLGSSMPLAPVTEEMVSTPSRVLVPFEGIETWTKDRRYLVAPAVMKMCPFHVWDLVPPPRDYFSGKQENDNQSPFSSILLGKAFVAVLETQKYTDETYGWSSGCFVLRQNYLLEYETGDDLNSQPRSYAHLQNSSVQTHENFPGLLELQFYTSSSRSENFRVLLIRPQKEEERDHWVFCLKEASKMTIDDLYECDDTEYGKGRCAVIRPARRRKKSRYRARCENDSSFDDEQQHNDNHSNQLGGVGLQGDNDSSIVNQNHRNHYTSSGHSSSKPKLENYDCALKIIDKVMFYDRVKHGKERLDGIVRETAVPATMASMAKAKNLNKSFLRLKGYFETAQYIVLETELLKGTDLFGYVSEKGKLDEKEAAVILKDLLVCLNDMQKVGVVHRDVKPANILMANPRETGVTVKLGDFGMATFVGVDGLVRGRCGTPGYVAPEILAAGLNNGYGKNVDVFSAGVTLYILLCGYEPFYGENDAELIKANREAKVNFPAEEWSSISLEGRDLVERMLKANPKQRISAAAALEHPWITRRTSPSSIHEDELIETQSSTDSHEDSACTIS